MKFNDESLKKILLEGGYVTKEDIDNSDKYSKLHKVSFIEYLITENLITSDIVGQAISEAFSIPFSNLKTNRPEKETVLLLPEDFSKKYSVVLIKKDKKGFTFATDNPTQEGLFTGLQKLFPDEKIIITYALQEEIESLFLYYKKSLETEFNKILSKNNKFAPEIVDQIFEDALLLKASDIHFEPRDTVVIVRFRIDGVLQEAGSIPKQYYENIINRIKVQSKLRIDEHFIPQDGALRYTRANYSNSTDMRVSIVPTLNGEKIVIRILSSYIRDLSLTNIGLPEDLQKQIIISAKKPFGMILVTGPTGSGKTTTLYSLIKYLNTNEVNITTIEDPVEYKIEGINQIQANSQSKLNFAQGLKSVARQDPDVIFVGEIRDIETADIAVNAALTGHLLLSTFHANNAATAIPRFIDMGIEPFLLASTFELIISQRLVRKICDSCKMSHHITKTDLKKYGPDFYKLFEDTDLFYKGKGCSRCSGTGFSGRIGVFEYIKNTTELQDLISRSPSTKEVEDLISKNGFRKMFDDGIEKVKMGLITIDELLRVVPLENNEKH